MKKALYSFALPLVLASSVLLGVGDTWEALVFSQASGSVTPILLPTGTAEPSVSVGSNPTLAAITPDATTALVSDLPDGNIYVLDLTQNPFVVTTTISGLNTPIGIAITPDGKRAVVAEQGNPPFIQSSVTILDLTTNPITVLSPPSPIMDPNFNRCLSVAITPDGNRALVTNQGTPPTFVDGSVSVIDLTTYSVSTPIMGLGQLFLVAITPDGQRALVADASKNVVHVLDLTSSPISQLPDIIGFNNPSGVAISRDGKRALISNQGTGPGTGSISLLDLTRTPIAMRTPLTGLGQPTGISFSPDGTQAVVSDQLANVAYIIDMTKNPIRIVKTIPGLNTPIGVAITPDQAPTASFTYVQKGSTFTFNASKSFSPVGEIASYSWDFGDQNTLVTDNPKVKYTYAVPFGSFKVTLTVTNTAGTSTAISTTFTGQTMSNHGGPSAQTDDTVTISSPSPMRLHRPAFFRGKVHFYPNKLELSTWWGRSLSRNVHRFEIFAWGEKIASIPSTNGRYKTFELPSEEYPHHFTNNFRLFLNDKYKIRAVDKLGNASPFKHLKTEQ